jgi:LPS sulfotransferase NodH
MSGLVNGGVLKEGTPRDEYDRALGREAITVYPVDQGKYAVFRRRSGDRTVREPSPPRLSYTIWFSQRTGSTLLCRALEITGLAGHPGEHLVGKVEELYARHGARTPVELRAHIWRIASTSNGVLGIKHGMMEQSFSPLLDALGQIEGHHGTRPSIWANMFPNGQHIFMTRRNKIRLAVSWWEAIQSQEWHRSRGASPRDVDIANRYDSAAINHLVVESVMREAAIQDFFTQGQIVPLTVVYEDFASRYEQTVIDILRWLGLEAAAATITAPAYEQLSDALSEDWVQRFRRDKQARWKHRAW